MRHLAYVVLYTPDMERMRHFYEHGLGLRVVEEDPESVRFGSEGAGLVLQATPEDGRHGIQIRFLDSDLDARARELAERGVTIEGGVQSMDRGRMVSFHDSESSMLSLYEPARRDEDPEVPEKKLSVVVVHARDMEKAKRFYQDFLEVAPTIDSPWWVQFDTGGTSLALHPWVERDEREHANGGAVTVGFTDDDVIGWVTEMRSRGVEASPPKDEGLGLRAEVADPDGNHIAFSEPSPAEAPEERLAEAFEDEEVPGRIPIRKPLKKGSRAVSRIAVNLGRGAPRARKAARKAAQSPERRSTSTPSPSRVASARGEGPAGTRRVPKRRADTKRARAKPAIGRLKKSERRSLTAHKQAVARTSKSKPVKRAAARASKGKPVKRAAAKSGRR